MQLRVQNNQDVTDLLIGGVEVSLWMAEQWAADLRRIFPNLNVTTTSTNKYACLVSFVLSCWFIFVSSVI